MKQFKISLCLCIVFNTIIQAQYPISDVNTYLYNNIYKNIAAFNIKYSYFSVNGSARQDIFRSNSDFFYDAFLPDYGYKLEMEIKKTNMEYPNKQFDLYEILINSFKYRTDNDSASTMFMGKWTKKDFLLALNKNNGEIKFIGGQFFISAIANDFDLHTNIPSSYIDYLRFKLFPYHVTNINFIKRKNKKLYFEGISEYFNRKINIILSLRDVEHVLINF